MTEAMEPMLIEDEDRFFVNPENPAHPDILALYTLQRKNYWWDTDVSFCEKDRYDWIHLTDEERFFVENILAFFATADGIVMENLSYNLSRIQYPEARKFFALQNQIEQIHSDVYIKLLFGYVADPKRRGELLRASRTSPAVARKLNWARRWTESTTATLAERLLAFICIEGISFQGAFAAVFWLLKRGVLPALTYSNKLISADELLHTRNGNLLFQKCVNRPTLERAKEIVLDMVDAEVFFITETLKCALIGMNQEIMKEYIRYVAQRLFSALGYGNLYDPATIKPAPSFMELTAFGTKENFFEVHVSNYQNSVETIDTDDINFDMDV